MDVDIVMTMRVVIICRYHGVHNNLNFKKSRNNEKCGKEKDSQNKP
jgi:hypothetical protein